MKKILTVITLLFLTAQTLDEFEKGMVAKNHIRSKTQIDYKYKNGVMSGSGVKVSVTSYNSNGDILEKDILNPKGLVVSSEKYEYDGQGNRTYYMRNSSNGKYEKRAQYDSHNNLILEAGFNGAEHFKNTYSYNSNDRLEEIVFTVEGNTTEKHVYHNNGNTATVEVYTAGTSLTSKLKLVYDSKGNILQQTVLSLDGRELEKKINKYDAQSNLIEEEKTKNGNLSYQTWYDYDSQGNLLTVSEQTPQKKKFIKKSFTYDGNGNLTDYKWHRSPGEPYNVKSFTYNSRGICETEHTFYPATKYELLSKFQYDY